MRLGIFGGTFDPPHVGHVLAASDALEHLSLDLLIFVPAAVQPLKAERLAAAAADRLAMVRLAVGGDPRFRVDSVEVEREGLSYMVDTLAIFANAYPSAERFLLVGSDVLSSFSKWRDPHRVLELARLAVLTRRPQHDADGEAVGAGAPADGWSVDIPGRSRHAPMMVPTRRIDVSSTEIRERVRAGKSIRGFVADPVEAFIGAHGLYRQGNQC